MGCLNSFKVVSHSLRFRLFQLAQCRLTVQKVRILQVVQKWHIRTPRHSAAPAGNGHFAAGQSNDLTLGDLTAEAACYKQKALAKTQSKQGSCTEGF